MRNLLHILFLALFLPSCFHEEEIVPPHEQGDLEEGQAAQGTAYENQVYYDLFGNAEIESHLISEYDLSFESNSGEWTIRLNSAKFMLAGNTEDTVFSNEINQLELEMVFDKSDGNPDSTAIGEWIEVGEESAESKRFVYLIDRGIDEKIKPAGFKKVQFDVEDDAYVVRYANTDNSRDTTVLIPRDPEMDRVYFSFDSGLKEIAPLPDEWSLLFSKYTTMLVTDEGENYPYLVTGALLNPNTVVAVRDTIHEFDEITQDNILGLGFTDQSDVIGYDWKYYNFDAETYTIVLDMNYVIRDRDGFFYKLRFIDFNNDLGERGYPKFEFVRL
jgi:hypothetical protein